MIRLSAIELEQLIKPKYGKKTVATKKSVAAQVTKLQAETKLHLQGLPAYVTEHRFHPTRRWRFDYAWPELKIAVEVHGGTYTNGRHTRGGGFTVDREKMNEAAIYGWTVLEVTAAHVRSGQMRQWLDRIFEHKGVAA
jgi:hypothetical protein